MPAERPAWGWVLQMGVGVHRAAAHAVLSSLLSVAACGSLFICVWFVSKTQTHVLALEPSLSGSLDVVGAHYTRALGWCGFRSTRTWELGGPLGFGCWAVPMPPREGIPVPKGVR